MKPILTIAFLIDDFESISGISQIIILAVGYWWFSEWLIECGRMVR